MTNEQIAKVLNDLAAEDPFVQRLQALRDLLTDEAMQILRFLVDHTEPQ